MCLVERNNFGLNELLAPARSDDGITLIRNSRRLHEANKMPLDDGDDILVKARGHI